MRDAAQDRLARRLAHRLDLGGLSGYQARRLAAARQRALALARGADLQARLRRLAIAAWQPALRSVPALVLVLAVVLGGDYLSERQHLEETRRLDGALLVDDLPIDAYLDEGFRAWLASGSDS